MEVVYKPSRKERKKLKEPLGRVIKDKEKVREELSKVEGQLILVGDYVSINFESSNPDVSIVDRRIEREEIEESKLEGIEGFCLKADNPAGLISEGGWDKVKEGIAREDKAKLRVKGEEDLLGIPVMYSAPLESVMVYGLRGRGSVIVEIDEEIKEKVRSFVDRGEFEKIIVGGSWSYLHPGHKYLLLTAFERGRQVSIGVTSDEMVESKLERDVRHKSYEERVSELRDFLREFGFAQRSEVHKIQDFKGNAVEEGDAIVVSKETYDNAAKINRIRERKGKQPLEIIKIPMIKNREGKPFSSSEKRKQN